MHMEINFLNINKYSFIFDKSLYFGYINFSYFILNSFNIKIFIIYIVNKSLSSNINFICFSIKFYCFIQYIHSISE